MSDTPTKPEDFVRVVHGSPGRSSVLVYTGVMWLMVPRDVFVPADADRQGDVIRNAIRAAYNLGVEHGKTD